MIGFKLEKDAENTSTINKIYDFADLFYTM